jgi:hypothetical protein
VPKIDFAGVGEPEEWTPAPSGEYVLQLIEAEDGEIQSGPNKGNEKSSLKFEIVDCEGELEKFNGRQVYYTATYGEKALPVVKSMLRAFGAKVPDEEGAEPLEWDWDELIGQKLRARLRSVGARKDKNDPTREYPPKNEISRFLLSEDDEEE